MAFGAGDRLAVCTETAIRSPDAKREARRDMPAEVWIWNAQRGGH